jgi:hypothetical protein
MNVTMGARQLYWNHVEDKTILAIEAEPMNPEFPDTAWYWHINFYVEGYRLSLTTNADTDEIIVAVEPAPIAPPTDPTMVADLRALVGRSFGWNWSAVNSQGYSDMLILAFYGEAGGGVTPQLAFLVEGSTIHVHRICKIGDLAPVTQVAQ